MHFLVNIPFQNCSVPTWRKRQGGNCVLYQFVPLQSTVGSVFYLLVNEPFLESALSRKCKNVQRRNKNLRILSALNIDMVNVPIFDETFHVNHITKLGNSPQSNLNDNDENQCTECIWNCRSGIILPFHDFIHVVISIPVGTAIKNVRYLENQVADSESYRTPNMMQSHWFGIDEHVYNHSATLGK